MAKGRTMKRRLEAASKAVFDIRDDAYDTDEWSEIGSDEREYFECQARAAVSASDAVTFSSKAILRAAEAAAMTDDYDGCFERVRAWEATEQWEKDAYPMEYPFNDYEDCAVWLKRTRSIVAALKGEQP